MKKREDTQVQVTALQKEVLSEVTWYLEPVQLKHKTLKQITYLIVNKPKKWWISKSKWTLAEWSEFLLNESENLH
jgi:hypothetical protein